MTEQQPQPDHDEASETVSSEQQPQVPTEANGQESPNQATAAEPATAPEVTATAEPEGVTDPVSAAEADAAASVEDAASTADESASDAVQQPAETEEPMPGVAEPTPDAAQPASGAEEPAPSTEAPPATPTPAQVPKPSAIPTPAAIAPRTRPRAAGATPPSPVASPAPEPGAVPTSPVTDPGAPPMDPAEVAAASTFGRVADDGTVYVREAGEERVVGQFPDVTEAEALSLYIRRYLDLKAQVDLFEARIAQLTIKDLDSTQHSLAEALEAPAAVGDLDGLRSRFDELKALATERRRQINAEREQARAQALAERTTLVEQAEEIAAMDPARVQWKAQGQTLRDLLDSWKAAQKAGPRIDRASEDALWKRFAAARSTFDKNRRQFFAELDKTHAEVKQVKERLIEKAEALSNSTEWGPTTLAYRDLMAEWKASGRAARKEDDALWARFRAAQDVFFEARNATNAQIDAEYSENLTVKLAILDEAEALLPVGDLREAKAKLRDIQDRWEAAGKVPRGDVQRIEGRMRTVEEAIRDADQNEWRRKNPRVRARAEGAAAQLEDAIAGLEQDLEKAQASGDERAIASATEALEARRAWLEQVLRAADDSR
ncbi:DUF349 domain-containing protein [Ruania halotolerans]|uniref:DUF349 domain-containing protein n=1 Tax=Ruania halotolerans TaxID=2897773 RepID=UPI001E4F05B8|nr:DUF349 domain-containing protein [Ruania halotolerans]UFU04759.1 DUF349 domain-containing protein [Ruania halotolerans]